MKKVYPVEYEIREGMVQSGVEIVWSSKKNIYQFKLVVVIRLKS